MELQHFSHEHLLILNEEQNNFEGELRHYSCSGCGEPIIMEEAFYRCNEIECEFFLHKICAELPIKLKHDAHHAHFLTLYKKPRLRYTYCDVCSNHCKKFTYSCEECDFDMDIICTNQFTRYEECALTTRKIKHEGHNHPLTPIRESALFLCHACGIEHKKGLSYYCTNCNKYWIHEECVFLRKTIKHIDHDHNLTLYYSIPDDYYKFWPKCDICAKDLRKNWWVYCCNKCRYFAHVNCAKTNIEPFMSIFLPRGKDEKGKAAAAAVMDLGVIHLPVLDDSVCLVSHIMKGMELGDDVPSEKELINHFGHDHPLILFDHVETIQNSKDEILVCDACVQPISVPFYRCTKCNNFLLHKCCAELPTVIQQHPFHRKHPLTLLAKSPERFGVFMCDGCWGSCNGFSYSCSECDYSLDVLCSTLPHAIEHEAHIGHVLNLNNERKYRCGTCAFNFPCSNVFYPRMFRHRYDEHPFLSSYGPVKDHSREDYCEICEKEIDPRNWFYYCGECDQFMHLRCTRPASIKFGATLDLESHPHSLTLSPVAQEDEKKKCNKCKGNFYRFSQSAAFKCLKCKFILHHWCASRLCASNAGRM